MPPPLQGAERLYAIIKDMTGVHANPFFKICWLYLTPLVLLVSNFQRWIFHARDILSRKKSQDNFWILG